VCQQAVLSEELVIGVERLADAVGEKHERIARLELQCLGADVLGGQQSEPIGARLRRLHARGITNGAAEHLKSDNRDPSSDEPRFFHLSEAETDLLSFAIFDILERVQNLKAGLFGERKCA